MTIPGVHRNIFSIVSVGFMLLLLLFFFRGNTSWMIAVSGAAFFFMAALLVALLDIAPVMLFLAAVLPFSVKLAAGASGTQVIFPAEMIEGFLFFVYFLRYFTGKQKFSSAFFLHPVTLCVVLLLAFSIISLAFSTMVTISVKALLVKTVYAGVYYFLFYEVVKNNPSGGMRYMIAYGLSLAVIAVYALVNHSAYDFSKDASGTVVLPFYADHTIYSACIAFVLPAFAAYSFNNCIRRTGTGGLIIFRIVTLLFIVAILFSLCRATWVSLACGMIMLVLVKIRVKPVVLFTLLAATGLVAYLNSDAIMGSFRQNRYDSNARGAGLEEQTKSITNIRNDQSNGERLNRWKCALRMVESRPLTGYGLGTYQFQYFPFQKRSEMTRISITNPNNIKVGHGGTAHSEYLLALSEGGLVVFVPFLLLVMAAIATGMRNIYKAADPKTRQVGIVLLVGLTTYLTHSFFNNFLDTDKAAFLFWAAAAMITAFDLKRKNGTHSNEMHSN